MQAQIINEFGIPSVLQLQEIPKPIIQPGHLLIQVAATSVNQIDCKIRSGVAAAIAPSFPAILQGDVAGTIVEMGHDIQNFKIGDEIFACAGGVKGNGGALAEYMLIDAKLAAIKPKNLTMQQSAALPLVAITAWNALFSRANLQKDQTVLIHGGVGGVGHIAVQLAKWRGAKVITTVLKPQDFAIAKNFGADEMIDAKNETVDEYVQRLTNGKGFNVVFDTVGGPNLDNSLQAAASNGVVVTIAARSTHDLSPLHNKGLSLHAVFMLLPLLENQGREKHGEILKQIATIAEAGQLTPLIDPNEFNLSTAKQAHELLESGKAVGKVVISI